MQKVLSSKKFLLLTGLALVCVFVGFSYLVHKNTFTQLDFDTTIRLQDHISRRFDTFFSFLSDIGKVEIVSVFLLLVCIFYRKWKTFLMFFPFGLFHFVEIYGKTFVHHLPPPQFMLRTQQVLNFPQFYVRTQNSYPSGHAGRALFMTAFFGVLIGKTKRLSKTQKVFIMITCYLYDVLMLISRVYLGEHWLSDIVGGSLLGAAMGLWGAVFL